MLKKRLIFTLLYKDGFFYQSRNFNLQQIGNVNWLNTNYNFKNISFFIDEIIILNLSKDRKKKEQFLKDIKEVTKNCFVPITIGGGINSIEDANYYLKNISDKILVNTNIFENPKIIDQISKHYGAQSILAGIDLKKINDEYFIFTQNGNKKIKKFSIRIIEEIIDLGFGELYIQSIDKDGSGTGLDLNILKMIPDDFHKPVIFSGGVGDSSHIALGLKEEKISAIATSNLLNFLGSGLKNARNELLSSGISFPEWDINQIEDLES